MRGMGWNIDGCRFGIAVDLGYGDEDARRFWTLLALTISLFERFCSFFAYRPLSILELPVSMAYRFTSHFTGFTPNFYIDFPFLFSTKSRIRYTSFGRTSIPQLSLSAHRCAQMTQSTSVPSFNHQNCISSTHPQPLNSPTEQSRPYPSSTPSPAP